MKPGTSLKYLFAVFITVVIGIGGCSSVPSTVIPPPDSQLLEEKEYIIGIGDQLMVSVWKNESLSVAVPVRPDGYISTPLVGDVKAAGKSAEMLAKDVKTALASYVRNPEVTVIVQQANSTEFLRRVRITGAVRNPLSVPYSQGMTVLDLVLLAGGPTEFASANKAKLYRKSSDGTKIYPVYLDEILKKGRVDSNYPLAPSDIVAVPERSF